MFDLFICLITPIHLQKEGSPSSTLYSFIFSDADQHTFLSQQVIIHSCNVTVNALKIKEKFILQNFRFWKASHMVSKCDVMKYVGPSTSVLCQKFQEMQAVDSREISALVRGVNTEPEFGLTLMKNRIICAHIFA